MNKKTRIMLATVAVWLGLAIVVVSHAYMLWSEELMSIMEINAHSVFNLFAAALLLIGGLNMGGGKR